MDITVMAVVFAPLLLLIGLGFIAAVDPYIRRGQRRVMLVIVALCLSLIAQNLLENDFFVSRSNLAFKNALAAYGYSVRPVILILFLCFIQPRGKKWLQWLLAGINAALYATSPFTKLCFEIRESDYILLRGPLWFVCFVLSAILLIELFAQTILLYRGTRRWERLIPIAVVVIIIGSVVLDLRVRAVSQPISFLTIAIAVSSMFYYIWLHMQFVREHEQALVAGQQVQLTLSQIKPHFLYNALGTIEELCDSNPSMARLATGKFSEYLRGNMDAIDRLNAIPFTRELEHTKLYLEIEQLRFRDALTVRYDITCTTFSMPALTLETLAENAVRHGIRKNERGIGTVSIATREAEDHYEISVTDDGPGFDVSTLPDDGRPHIGIRNVRERLRSVCGGRLEIASAPGKGTTATIIIPKTR